MEIPRRRELEQMTIQSHPQSGTRNMMKAVLLLCVIVALLILITLVLAAPKIQS